MPYTRAHRARQVSPPQGEEQLFHPLQFRGHRRSSSGVRRRRAASAAWRTSGTSRPPTWAHILFWILAVTLGGAMHLRCRPPIRLRPVFLRAPSRIEAKHLAELLPRPRPEHPVPGPPSVWTGPLAGHHVVGAPADRTADGGPPLPQGRLRLLAGEARSVPVTTTRRPLRSASPLRLGARLVHADAPPGQALHQVSVLRLLEKGLDAPSDLLADRGGSASILPCRPPSRFHAAEMAGQIPSHILADVADAQGEKEPGKPSSLLASMAWTRFRADRSASRSNRRAVRR